MSKEPTNETKTTLDEDDENTSHEMRHDSSFGIVCCGTSLATIVGCTILSAFNFALFWLMAVMGLLLRQLDDYAGNQVVSVEQRDVILLGLGIATQLILSLGIIYSLVRKNTRQSRKLLRAGVAVLGCCKRSSYPREALLPCSQVALQLCRNMVLGFLEACTVRMLLSLFLFLLLLFIGLGAPHGPLTWSPLTLSIALLLPSAILWIVVGGLLKKSRFFLEFQTDDTEETIELQTESAETSKNIEMV